MKLIFPGYLFLTLLFTGCLYNTDNEVDYVYTIKIENSHDDIPVDSVNVEVQSSGISLLKRVYPASSVKEGSLVINFTADENSEIKVFYSLYSNDVLIYEGEHDFNGQSSVTQLNSEVTEVLDSNTIATILVQSNISPQFTTIISEEQKTAYVDKSYELWLDATDLDGDELTYNLLDGPKAMNIINWFLQWVPDPQDIGIYNISVEVKDTKGACDTLIWQVNVTDTLKFFGFSQSKKTVKVGEVFTLDVIIKNVENLFGVAFEFNINPPHFQSNVSNFTKGSFLGADAIDSLIINNNSIITEIYRPPEGKFVSGTGTLYSYEFLALKTGVTDFTIHEGFELVQEPGFPYPGREQFITGNIQVTIE